MQSSTDTPRSKAKFFDGVTPYHWLVVIIASCGWLFDCMDQRLFVLARESALRELLGSETEALAQIKTYIGWATTALILGWATGGIIFGMMSDKIGRVKTMVATLIVYSGFTGLSGFAQSWVDFTIYRFLVGLGVGGMFGAATTLVAESVPGHFRSLALGSLQALSATGNIIGSLVSLWIPPGEQDFLGGFSGWRVLFFVGILPSLLVIPIVFVLKEPASWRRAKEEAKSKGLHRNIGSPIELFRQPRWRKNTIIGLLLGVSGMIGLWGIGFFSPELITTALKDKPLQAKELSEPAQICSSLANPDNDAVAWFAGNLSDSTRAAVAAAARSGEVDEPLKASLLEELNGMVLGDNLYDAEVFSSVELAKTTLALAQQMEERPDRADITFLNRQLLEATFPGSVVRLQQRLDTIRARGTALQDVGAFLGMMTFTFVASFLSRRLAFLGAFLLCLATTMFVFNSLNAESHAYWMLPMMGFAQLAVFAGYSIYFPELFPTRLRGTGVGFCYNTVRYLAAPFPALMGILSQILSFRSAAMMLALVYLVGIVALIWAPETKGKPLPEDEPEAA